MLSALSHISEGNYSQHLVPKFPELLDMNLNSFLHYLESCTFQTVQMKNTKYLAMKEDEEVVMIGHSSSLLDQYFIEANTKTGDSKRREREQLEKLKELRTQIEEEKKEKEKHIHKRGRD
eukprot:scpid36971/ scgid25299/ 